MNLHKIPVRLILSVIAGLITASVLSVITHEILHLCGIFPALRKPQFDTRLLIISLCYHSLFAVAGAIVTAWLAKDKARQAAFFLGSKEAVMWLIGIALLWKHAPAWFNITKAVLGIPLAVFGGEIYTWFTKNKSWPPQTTNIK